MRRHVGMVALIGALCTLGWTHTANAGDHGCAHQACGHQGCTHHGCNHCANPCARFYQYSCAPLPAISFSRYANNGDYDCVRYYFGDCCPIRQQCGTCVTQQPAPAYPVPPAATEPSPSMPAPLQVR